MSESSTRNSRTDHLHNVAMVPLALATEESVDMVIVLRTDQALTVAVTEVDTTTPPLLTPQVAS
jgi:hypothetical protein